MEFRSLEEYLVAAITGEPLVVLMPPPLRGEFPVVMLPA
jgi:hypothetical protein